MTVATRDNYAFYNEEAKAYLSCHGTNLVLSKTSFGWNLRELNRNRFNIYTGEPELLLDIDNAYIAEGTRIKLHGHTGYDVQIWSINKNENGTYSIAYSGDNRFCLGFTKDKPVLQLCNKTNALQQWRILQLRDTSPKSFLSVISKDNIIHLQLPPDITKILSLPRLQQWANDLETAYRCFGEMTNYTPFSNVTVEAYKPASYKNYSGWVTSNSNVIHVDRSFLISDLNKMALRKRDWNFCVLHEMGHMFDFGKPWNFEAELLTDIKVAYVMEKLGACAAPGEFSAFTVFKGADIIKAYKKLGSGFSEKYDIFSCAERFLKIKEKIGWTPFIQTFHYLTEHEAACEGYSDQQKLLTFINVLSRFSEKDIKSFFSTAEWNVMLNKCNGR